MHAFQQAYFAPSLVYSPQHAGALVEFTFLRPPKHMRPPQRKSSRQPDTREPRQGAACEMDTKAARRWKWGMQQTVELQQTERFLTFWLDPSVSGFGDRISAFDRAMEIGFLLTRTVVVQSPDFPRLFEVGEGAGRVSATISVPSSMQHAMLHGNASVHLILGNGIRIAAPLGRQLYS